MSAPNNTTEPPRPTDAAGWHKALQPLLSCKSGLTPDWCHDLARLAELLAERSAGIDAFDFISRLYSGSGVPWLWSSEEFHSNLLAWLLDPNENHGLGDRFLKGFLSRTGAPSKIQSADWMQATVMREWENYVDGQLGYLDLLVLAETGDPKGCLLAIENKIFSEEHSGQLTRYRMALADRYPELCRHHVFLSPDGRKSKSAEERKCWKAAGYTVVLDVLKELTDRQDGEVAEDVRAFLKQYATTLRRNIVPDTSAQQMARKIYLANRELFETILANRPDYAAESLNIVREFIKNHPDLELAGEESGYIGFVPVEWTKVSKQQTSTSVHYPLMHFGFSASDHRAYINFGIEPGCNPELRTKIAKAINGSQKIFSDASKSLGTGWTRFHVAEGIIKKVDYDSWDDAATREDINGRLSQFFEKEFRKITNFIAQNVPEYQPK